MIASETIFPTLDNEAKAILTEGDAAIIATGMHDYFSLLIKGATRNEMRKIVDAVNAPINRIRAEEDARKAARETLEAAE